MEKHDERLELDDAEFERLFASLDDVQASDELKSSTLAAILAQLDEGAADVATTPTTAATTGHRLTVIEGGAGRMQEAAPSDAEQVQATRGPNSVGDASHPARRARGRGLRLRVAAALVAVAVGLGGGVAYATPVTHVTTTSGETTYDLGVNLFGVTVSVEADSDDGRQLLDDLQLRHARFEDALDRLLEACEDADDDAAGLQVSVEGRGPFGDASSVAEKAQRVAKAHEQARTARESGESVTVQEVSQDPEPGNLSSEKGARGQPQAEPVREEASAQQAPSQGAPEDVPGDGEGSSASQQPTGGEGPHDAGQPLREEPADAPDHAGPQGQD